VLQLLILLDLVLRQLLVVPLVVVLGVV